MSEAIDWSKPIVQRCGRKAVCLETTGQYAIVMIKTEHDNWIEVGRALNGLHYQEETQNDSDILQSPASPSPVSLADVEAMHGYDIESDIEDGPDGNYRTTKTMVLRDDGDYLLRSDVAAIFGKRKG